MRKIPIQLGAEIADYVVCVAEHDDLSLVVGVGNIACKEMRGAYIWVDVSDWGFVDQDLDKNKRQQT